MSELCRICMNPKQELINLVQDGSEKLERSGEKFEDCFGIKIKELPHCQRICKDCDKQLIEFYYFKQQALRTHNYLIDKAGDVDARCVDIKEEVNEDEFITQDAGNSPVEFCNIEYLDEEAIHVSTLEFIQPKKETPHDDDQVKQEEEGVECIEKVHSEYMEEFEQIESLIDEDPNENVSESIAASDDRIDSSNSTERDVQTKEKIRNPFRKIKRRCNECSRNFKNEKTYQEHLRKHQREEDYYTKRRCGDHDMDKSAEGKGLGGRKKYKKNVDRYKYVCNVCDKRFLYDFSYQAHVNIHKGLSPYNCDLCGKGFKQKINYTYHMKNHYNDRDWKCNLCNKAFLVRWDLDLHMRSHNDTRPYMCDICGKGFRISCHLTSHRETHNETNIYECHLCQMKLHTKVTLTRHLASVHKVGRLKSCPFCEKQFVRLDRFKVHIGKYHGAFITKSISPTEIYKDETFIDI